jgi:hypothetical protein
MLHWNGKAWSQVTSPAPVTGGNLNAVTATAKSGWVIGMPIAMITGALARWNGSTWTWVGSYPVQGAYQPLEGIAAGPRGTAFAVGDDNNLPGPPISMRWTGKAWQKVPVTVPAESQLNAVTFAPGGTAWAAGTVGFGTADALVVRWSGKAWTRVASPSPGRDVALSGLGFATAGNGWAVGAAGAGSDTSTTVILHWNGKTWS